MADSIPLATLVPETTVGLAVIWREPSGAFGATWRDTDRVPMMRTEAAHVLRLLADALDAQAEEMPTY